MEEMNTIDEPVDLSNYDSNWPYLFCQEARIIKDIFKERLLGIEHIGSTSIPNLVAKPIIDIMIGLPDFYLSHTDLLILSQFNYEYLGEAGVPGRHYLRKRQNHKFNLAITVFRSKIWNDNIKFREYLKSTPEIAAKYGRLKQEIIKDNPNLLKYSQRKSSFIQSIIE